MNPAKKPVQMARRAIHYLGHLDSDPVRPPLRSVPAGDALVAHEASLRQTEKRALAGMIGLALFATGVTVVSALHGGGNSDKPAVPVATLAREVYSQTPPVVEPYIVTSGDTRYRLSQTRTPLHGDPMKLATEIGRQTDALDGLDPGDRLVLPLELSPKLDADATNDNNPTIPNPGTPLETVED